MPTYEYECRHCGRQFERRQAITEVPLATCPECGGEVHRLLSGGAGILVRGGDGHEREGHGSGSGFRENGTTCCGRPERCDRPPCGGDR
jgi:putative FmdB family regulatory protein